MSFENKVVLVTGASSGIGAATAIAFAAEGAKVAIIGRNQSKLSNTAEKCQEKGSKPLLFIADITKDENLRKIMKETIKFYGKLDVLINNAGIASQKSILAPDLMEDFDKIICTNFRAVVYLTNLAAPHLVQSKGNIVNVSSVAALAVMLKTGSTYAASKAGLDHFTRSIALELAEKGVRVNTVSPGPVKTDIMESRGITAEQRDVMMEAFGKQMPLGRVSEPEEIADIILFLASDKAKGVTGSTYVVDNGMVMNGVIASNEQKTQ